LLPLGAEKPGQPAALGVSYGGTSMRYPSHSCGAPTAQSATTRNTCFDVRACTAIVTSRCVPAGKLAALSVATGSAQPSCQLCGGLKQRSVQQYPIAQEKSALSPPGPGRLACRR